MSMAPEFSFFFKNLISFLKLFLFYFISMRIHPFPFCSFRTVLRAHYSIFYNLVSCYVSDAYVSFHLYAKLSLKVGPLLLCHLKYTKCSSLHNEWLLNWIDLNYIRCPLKVLAKYHECVRHFELKWEDKYINANMLSSKHPLLCSEDYQTPASLTESCDWNTGSEN